MAVYRVGSNKSSVNNFPSIRPTLDFDFANSKTLDPRIDFTRASGGSYVGADGLIKYAGINEPRFDHNPVTGESLGLLVEEGRTNLLVQSENLGTTWTLTGLTISNNTIIAPDGTQTADTITEDLSTGGHRIQQGPIFANSSGEYTYSIFVKPGTDFIARLQIDGNVSSVVSNAITVINLYTGIVERLTSANNITAISSSVVPLSNGWYRASLTFSIPAASNLNVRVFLQQNDVDGTASSYTGNGTSFIHLWGAQLEQGAFPTSYIPTQGSTRTRAVDNARIIDKNFTDFYNPNESTIYTEARGITSNIPPGGAIRYWEIGINSSFRIISGYRNLTTTTLTSINNNRITQVQQTNQNLTQFVKNVSSFKNNYFELYSNGKKSNNQLTSFDTLPSNVNLISLGVPAFGILNTHLNGTIKRFTYWPKILPNEQLQALTR